MPGVQLSIVLCLVDIAAGMSYLHSIGLLHSDLKGGNVLLKSCATTKRDPRGFVCKVLRSRPQPPEALMISPRTATQSAAMHPGMYVVR